MTDDDRHIFLDTIGQMAERFDDEIFAHVFMDNTFICYVAHKEQIYPEACSGLAPPIRTGFIQTIIRKKMSQEPIVQRRVKSL